ncbi:restriction endonuclease [Tolypothrix sp. VBCCA 56010]|uniref:restriction endonuclease n=1 Tax=Tolypothrix sp. VBCCA 56010 TaxID=3137731 RepID=UPI003D7E7B13
MHHTQFTVTKARQWLDTIRPITLNAPRIEWLPKVIGSFRRQHEFIAEEIILHCFRDAGWSAEKLGGYTRDGGIDGICAIDELFFLIQVKRYQGNINALDVEAFARVIADYARKHPKVSHGFFIHSGKTGKLAKEAVNHYRDVILISGNHFVDFILTPALGLEQVLERKIRRDAAA